MKKIITVICMAGMLILYGCPAQTEKSIDNGSYNVPTWMSGNWTEIKSNGKGDSYFLESVKASKGNILVYSLDSLGKHSSDSRRVILSEIGGAVFLNVYDAGDDEMSDPGWYLYKFQVVSKTEFTLLPLKENVVPRSATQEELRVFLEKNKDSNDIFDESQRSRYQKQK